MSTPAQQLRDLRAQCLATVTILDALLELCPETGGQERFGLAVQGRCRWATQHALDRWRERTGSKKGDEAVLNRMASAIASGAELELKPKFRLVEMLSHGVHSRFFSHGGMIFVVEEDILVTVHAGEADRWQPLSAGGTAL